MRLLLKLKASKECVQSKENNSKFHTGVHGWIYNKLKNTEFSETYNKRGFKPFCFSNLFSITDEKITENEVYNLIISSPEEMFMVALISHIDKDEKINLGEYSFELVEYKPLGKKEINNGNFLESETVINITINENGKRKAITLNENPCCKGLKHITTCWTIENEKCIDINCTYSACINCGDGICKNNITNQYGKSLENKCNCPQDCG